MYKKKWLYWPVLLVIMIGTMFFSKRYYTTHIDGPYVTWGEKDRMIFTYLDQDTVKRIETRLIGNDTTLQGFLNDSETTYYISKSYAKSASEYTAEKVFIVGDALGTSWYLNKLLVSAKIMNEDEDWIFGKGHLVFNGNLIGGGYNVQETLQLIQKLEKQAEKAGGKVHILIGKYELATLQGDLGFLEARYKKMGQKLKIDYKDFYAPGSNYGNWLSSKNVAVKINGMLISHAGLSETFTDSISTISDLNNSENFLKIKEKDAPVLFTGYLPTNTEVNKIESITIQNILKKFSADKMIVSSFPVDSIQNSFSNMVIAVGIPANKGISEGLLQEGKDYYRITRSGKKIKL